MDLCHRPLNKPSFRDHLSRRIFKVCSFCLKNIALGNSWVKAVLGNSWESDFAERKLTTPNVILTANLTSTFFNKAFVYNITSGLNITCFSQHENVRSLMSPSLCVQWCTGKWNRGNRIYLEMANKFTCSGFDTHRLVWPLSWGQAMTWLYTTVRAPSETGVVLDSGVQIQSKFITDLAHSLLIHSWPFCSDLHE